MDRRFDDVAYAGFLRGQPRQYDYGNLAQRSQRRGILHPSRRDRIRKQREQYRGQNGCQGGSGNDIINFDVSSTITLAATLPTIVNTLIIDGVGQSITVNGNAQTVMEVASTATASLRNLTISGGNGSGTAGVFNNGTLNVTDCTLSGNSGSSGAINNQPSSILTVINSTFSSNSIGIDNIGSAAVTNSTFSGNGNGTLASAPGKISFRSTIFASSRCLGPTGAIVDDGYNISSDNSCGFSGTSKFNTDPKLSSAGLANNGGPTETIALAPGSPAIDAIPFA